MYLHELSGSKFHSVTIAVWFCTMMLKTQFSSKVDLSGFGTELFNCLFKYLSSLHSRRVIGSTAPTDVALPDSNLQRSLAQRYLAYAPCMRRACSYLHCCITARIPRSRIERIILALTSSGPLSGWWVLRKWRWSRRKWRRTFTAYCFDVLLFYK